MKTELDLQKEFIKNPELKEQLKYLEKNDYRSILIDTPKFNSLILFPFTLFKVLILTINSLKILKKEKISYLIFHKLVIQFI